MIGRDFVTAPEPTQERPCCGVFLRVPDLRSPRALKIVPLDMGQGGESGSVDYKSVEDLSQTADEMNLAKDVAAFQAAGGHLVIGADDHGVPTGKMTVQLAKLFDEATLRPKMLKYLPEPLRVTTAVHTVNGHLLVLVYVHPHPDGLAVSSETPFTWMNAASSAGSCGRATSSYTVGLPASDGSMRMCRRR
ncbi:helix-turn-helix domain-containing protein [Streptomyces tsukubensis]|uniref:AlbA family DNA-binding domain-containing protein n=1 Tax=Streptomyces tsukubensis TaxID=83656 RepID=UPI0036CC0B2B